MKYFLIGIDGAQEELFFRFNLPFIQKNLSKGVNISLEEDLISRGWSEICTGVYASVSAAFYERTLNGYSVGIMNVPTTNIAPKVNSFFVSGGGAKLRNLSLEYLNRLQKINNFLFNFSS